MIFGIFTELCKLHLGFCLPFHFGISSLCNVLVLDIGSLFSRHLNLCSNVASRELKNFPFPKIASCLMFSLLLTLGSP